MPQKFYSTDYALKYKDITVLTFNLERMSLVVHNPTLLPIPIQNAPVSFEMIRKFCSDRMLIVNRVHCKEILTACGIDDQSDINICIVCKGLSFRDNYWITSADSNDTWENVNLYHNPFSLTISQIALTGDLTDSTVSTVIKDDIYTGELTNKGTRAKCYFRENDGLYLYKHETHSEIMSEIAAYYIASALRLPCSQYFLVNKFNRECSMCQIFTSEEIEMIPCRDVMSHYNESSTGLQQNTYRTFMQIDPVNFIKMQIFDYVTLNVDRNRDNYGLLQVNGKLTGLFPVFDHDSCFKGKSTEALYFPSGTTFDETLKHLKSIYTNGNFPMLCLDIHQFKTKVLTQEFKDNFLLYKSLDEYNAMLNRINHL